MAKQNPTARPGIYQIRNTINGKIYIGSAINIRRRYGQHRQDLTRGNHPNKHLQAAWNLSGPDAFVFEVLRFVNKKENLLRVEQFYLDRYQPYSRERGYNNDRIAGSSLGLKRSAETRAKVSASLKGRKLSPECIAKIAASITGREVSKETRAKISSAHKGRKPSAEVIEKRRVARQYEPLSPEHRAKIGASQVGQKRSPEARANMAEARRKAMADPNARANISEKMKSIWRARKLQTEASSTGGVKVYQMTLGFHADSA